MKIYADSLFLLNFIIDYLLLLAAGKICGAVLRRRRLVPGAVWGGVYAVLAAMWPGFFALWTVKLLSGLLAVFIAYGGQERFIRPAASFFAVSAAFGGAVYAVLGMAGQRTQGLLIPVNMKILALSFALCYAAVSLIFRHMGRRAQKTLLRVRVLLGDKELEFTALEDSGNELCDPLSGEKILILSPGLARELLGEQLPCGAAEKIIYLGSAGRRGRLLSFNSLGGRGLMACFHADEVSIEGKARDLLLAIAENEICPSGDYRAII